MPRSLFRPKLRKAIAAAALLAGAAILPQTANAASAFVVGPTEIHAGPDYDYPTVDVVDDGRRVEVYGCLDDLSWCDVSFYEDRGWVPAESLVSDYYGDRRPIYDIAPYIGIGILAFSFDTYWDRYYRGRPFFGERGRWFSYSHDHFRPSWHGGHTWAGGHHFDRGGPPRGGDHHFEGPRDGGHNFDRNDHRDDHRDFNRGRDMNEHERAPEARGGAPFQGNTRGHPQGEMRQQAAPHPQAAPGGGGQPHQGHGGGGHEGGHQGGGENNRGHHD